ncbi:hypothetical protein [Agarilytica rhodophyticola]|uniref:hypothetical protein n=1 Tax=Agarilytica rhodophyticola TaxID=1737490 RepID=UPI000B344825|nr:hypothetical protein [Agarilytica rhodophyticola]
MISRTLKPMLFACLVVALGNSFNAQAEHNEVVGVLKSRHYVVEMYSGKHEPLYTVKNIQGDMLAANLTGSELVSQIPELEHVIYGYADDASLGIDTANGWDGLDL